MVEYLEGTAEAGQILQPLVLAGPASAGATEPLVCVVAGHAEDGDRPAIDSQGFRHAIAKLSHGYRLVVLHGPPLGDASGALRAAAAEADVALACVGPALAGGRAGRRLRRGLRRLPIARTETIVYG
jgi:hypothetical protein